MRVPYASLVPLVLIAVASTGCHRRSRSGVIVGDAQAAMPAGMAAARAVMGSDDEDDDSGTPGKVNGNGQGQNKWRDCGLYVDGRPVGVLSFGEIPIGLKPVWKAEEHSVEFDVGYTGPRTRTTYERRYRMIDYLKAVGVDLAQVKELHIMGPKLTEVMIATGKQMRSKEGQEVLFRFGGIVRGKPIPAVPFGFGNGKHSDKIGAVMVYVNKKPPTLINEEGLAFDGKIIDGIPYYGDPMRGGVRLYNDDVLDLQIKRPMLKDLPAEVGADGKQRWKLWSVLEQKGVDTSKVVEGWAIADERRKQKYTRAELEQLTFQMGEKNSILVGDGKLRVHALALHSRALSPADLPQIRPDEEQ